MIAAKKKSSGKFNVEMFDDVPVLQRKWHAAAAARRKAAAL